MCVINLLRYEIYIEFDSNGIIYLWGLMKRNIL